MSNNSFFTEKTGQINDFFAIFTLCKAIQWVRLDPLVGRMFGITALASGEFALSV